MTWTEKSHTYQEYLFFHKGENIAPTSNGSLKVLSPIVTALPTLRSFGVEDLLLHSGHTILELREDTRHAAHLNPELKRRDVVLGIKVHGVDVVQGGQLALGDQIGALGIELGEVDQVAG